MLVGPRRIEMQEFPVPRAGEDDGVLEVEVAGVCGSDVFHYNGTNAPIIMGHEIVGRISDIGPGAQDAWGVGAGDRVVVETTFGCGRCERCRMGMYRMCNVSKGYGGAVKSDLAPHLWGGYGQYVYLPPTARVHRISEELPGDVAVLVCAVLGNGVRWLRTIGGVTIGDTAVVVGPGPQGLAATVAARESGAREIVVVGLSRDEARLSMARRLGATRAIAADLDDPRDVVAELTDGAMANVVIDVTNTADSPTAGAGPGGDGRDTGAGGRRGPATEPAHDGQDHGGGDHDQGREHARQPGGEAGAEHRRERSLPAGRGGFPSLCRGRGGAGHPDGRRRGAGRRVHQGRVVPRQLGGPKPLK